MNFTLDDELIDVTPVLNKDKDTADLLDIRGLMESALGICDATFKDPNFLKLLRDPTEEFDAIIVELYELDIYTGYVENGFTLLTLRRSY